MLASPLRRPQIAGMTRIPKRDWPFPAPTDRPLVALAPMAGWTDAPFRRQARRFGADLVVSEMIASREAIIATRAQPRLVADFDAEWPMSVQIAGWDPGVMADAARLCRDLGARMIDINMGCPAKKITKRLAGSALMQDEALAGRIMEATVAAVDIPVTLKMRLGWTSEARNAAGLARIAEQAGIRMLAVHGRTGCQKYRGVADWSAVGAIRRASALPLLINGDIRSVEDAAAALAQSGADGVMIGRGSQGRPWFLGQVAAYLKDGTHRPAPSPLDILSTALEHFDAMLLQYGRYSAVRRARKHLSCYLSGIDGAADRRRKIMAEDDPSRVKALLHDALLPDSGPQRLAA